MGSWLKIEVKFQLPLLTSGGSKVPSHRTGRQKDAWGQGIPTGSATVSSPPVRQREALTHIGAADFRANDNVNSRAVSMLWAAKRDSDKRRLGRMRARRSREVSPGSWPLADENPHRLRDYLGVRDHAPARRDQRGETACGATELRRNEWALAGVFAFASLWASSC